MPGNFKKEDLRVIKTRKVLIEAMLSLLYRHNFDQITVNDLCEEALVSRAAFYTHFESKYDLLKYWMTNLRDDLIQDISDYNNIRMRVNSFADENPRIITNVVGSANTEILEMLHGFMGSIIDLAIVKGADEPLSEKQILLSNFCAGGLVRLLTRQVENKFPPVARRTDVYLYQLLDCLLQWDATQSTQCIGGPQ